ncbi:stalk domain-containing protein [Paenibacillus contaminans]|uniref:Copper amine oxidase-like N-terminal domain-containing protein n=1 Tax=Paenibacillus contaminans TaxID=450362 RepID=A0A329MEI4_9BACL|nr:stalk domain-containing protein [Paenibacillus contaminans]RAV17656.1 hypothetical protein DQG23_26350 [Paenibacillus contaminans]
MRSRFIKWAAGTLLAASLLLTGGSPYAWAEEAKPASAEAAVTITIDGKLQTYSQPAVIVGQTTMVPMRAIFQALGAKIEWDNDTRTVTAVKAYTKIKLAIGLSAAVVSGEPVVLEEAPLLVNDNTMVPVRFIGEALGATVTWDNATRTVKIATAPPISRPKPQKPLDVRAAAASPTAELPVEPQPSWKPVKAVKPPVDAPEAGAKEWRTFATSHYQVYYTEQEETVFAIAKHLDAIYLHASETLDHALSYKIPLALLNKEDYEKAVKLSWSEGEWNVKDRKMMIKLDEPSLDRLLITALHETVHAITLSADASKSKTYPFWFMEGAATYHELDAPFYAAMRDLKVYEALAANKLMTWDELAESSDKWENVELGYALSQSIYAFLAERYGEPAIASIFFTRGLFNDQLQLISNQTVKELERQWIADLKRKTAANKSYPGIYYGKDWKYVGELLQGRFHGFGRYYENGKLVYEGDFKDGEVEGQGTLYYESGARYVGSLRGGKPDGQGTAYDEHGNVRFSGEFRDNTYIQ